MMPGKICIKCGRDCSGTPRTKDAQGRYTCRECYDKLMAARAGTPATSTVQPAKAVEVKPRIANAAPVGAPANPIVAGAPATGLLHDAAPPNEEPALTLDDGAGFGEGIPLEDDAAGITSAAAAQPTACPGCGVFLPHGTVICTRCGMNTQTGQALGTQKLAGEGRQCIKCGYSLKGLKSMKCPECGTVNVVKSLKDQRREQDRKTSRQVARNAYLKPLLAFAVGLTIAVLLASQLGADPKAAIISLLVQYAIFVPIGVIVFFLCCLAWLGFDAPMHLSALRLAAVFAITDAVAIPSLALGFYAIGVLLCVMAIAIHTLMDLDIPDSFILALLLLVVMVVVYVALISALQNAE